MKLFTIILGILAYITCTNAQYFSEGWSPGQRITTSDTPAPSYTPNPVGSTQKAPADSLLDRILTFGPVASFLQRAGVNVTERLLTSQLWDDRIPLITDNNYYNLIVNEQLTEEEERNLVWFLIITVTAARKDGVSRVLDNVFDEAYNASLSIDGLSHVRWGRIDYLSVTTITTKWAVWQAPYVVVLKDRGQTLRFYKPYQLKLNSEAMLEFLRQDGWKMTKPWSSAYAPGGSREYLMEYLASFLTKVYNVTVMIPSWLLFLISGGLASVLIRALHRIPATPSTPARRPQPRSNQQTPDQAKSSSVLPATSPAKRPSVKQRKSGKK